MQLQRHAYFVEASWFACIVWNVTAGLRAGQSEANHAAEILEESRFREKNRSWFQTRAISHVQVNEYIFSASVLPL
jgi:hypothetical protein